MRSSGGLAKCRSSGLGEAVSAQRSISHSAFASRYPRKLVRMNGLQTRYQHSGELA